MVHQTVDAIYTENPFLGKFVARQQAIAAHVRQWNEAFLNRTPRSSPNYGVERLYLVNKDGGTVARVDSMTDHLWHLFGLCQNSKTVGQVLARINSYDVSKIRHAIGVWNDEVTLWKLPHGYETAEAWLRATTAKMWNHWRASA